mmetsp:Transcript_73896/g.196835  ORF Transcript_73896/g.196835 Transcript_73896/m.196835 type:complete len:113 (+) Transcript_73896:174-512(+)
MNLGPPLELEAPRDGTVRFSAFAMCCLQDPPAQWTRRPPASSRAPGEHSSFANAHFAWSRRIELPSINICDTGRECGEGRQKAALGLFQVGVGAPAENIRGSVGALGLRTAM